MIMGNRNTIWVVALVAVLLAGIAFAVARLYGTPSGEKPAAPAPQGWDILRSVPSDAAAVLVFDGSAKAARVLSDSTGLLQSVVAPGNPALMGFLSASARRKLAVSLHNSGALVPLIAVQVQPADSLLREQALKAGLKAREKDGVLLASRSETFVNAAVRCLEEGVSILGDSRLPELLKAVSGPAVVLVSHAHAPKILQVYAGKAHQQGSFVKDLTPWSAWTVQETGKDRLILKGSALPGESGGSFFGAFKGTPAQEATFPEVLPYFTHSALSLPVADPSAFLAARRQYEDGNGRLAQYNQALKAKAGRPLSPEEWFLNIQPREVVKMSFSAEDGVLREAVLVRSARDLKLGAEASNPYRGSLAQVLGPRFAVTDTSCASLPGKWSVYADLPTIRAFQDKSFLDYSLKSRLSDASVSLPEGFVAYASLSDAPELPSQLLASAPAAPVNAFIKGAGFAPAFVSLDLSGSRPLLQVQLHTRALKGTRVQVLERDTTVVVPTGLFPVTNYQSGKTNYLYQNNHLSICLNDENGKGVWGIPFKEPLCGRVQDIDYYHSGKIQFLFAAGNKLYLLDRLGHWVNGFPVSLPKPVLLGPDAYDFTGAGGYTVMVLHKDNTLERYNLHGAKPEGWKGIQAPETVKDLPELLESRGKRYWVVRTSVRTLVYPFQGGDALVKEEGGKMLKPDAQLTPTSKGVSGECYDGKTRDFKLN